MVGAVGEPPLHIVKNKGVGWRLAASVDLGFDLAVVGKAAFLQLGKDQFAIEADFKLPSV